MHPNVSNNSKKSVNNDFKLERSQTDEDCSLLNFD